MLTKLKVVLVLGLYLFCCKAVLGNYFFTKTTVGKINSNYKEITTLQASSLTICGVHCSRSTSCRYFMFNITTLACHLLGYSDGYTTAPILSSYTTWDIYTVGTKCPASGLYLREYDKCIVIYTDIELNWNQAQDFCQSDGGSLMNINSFAEFEFFREMFQSMLVQPQFFSLGARRTGPAVDDFHWVFGSSEGLRVDSSYWKTNQPDNSHGVEDCLASRSEDNFDLNDVTCDQYYGFFICEYLV